MWRDRDFPDPASQSQSIARAVRFHLAMRSPAANIIRDRIDKTDVLKETSLPQNGGVRLVHNGHTGWRGAARGVGPDSTRDLDVRGMDARILGPETYALQERAAGERPCWRGGMLYTV